MSVLPSGYQRVRFLVRRAGLADSLGVSAWGSVDGHPWPCSPGGMRRRVMANPPIIEATPKPGRLTIMVGPVTAKMSDKAM